jgi:hypothetical protein
MGGECFEPLLILAFTALLCEPLFFTHFHSFIFKKKRPNLCYDCNANPLVILCALVVRTIAFRFYQQLRLLGVLLYLLSAK